MRLALGVAALGILAGCGTVEATPPRAPAAEIPRAVEARTTPPEPGTTRVLLDANGDRATVEEVVERATATAYGSHVAVSGYAESTKPVCVTPCYADLKPGMHALRFKSMNDDRMSEAPIQVGDVPKTVRHAMGRAELPSVGNYLASFGVILGATAAIGIGAPLWAAGEATHHDDLTQPGMWAVGAGLGTFAVSLPLYLLTRPVYQNGSTTEIAAIR